MWLNCYVSQASNLAWSVSLLRDPIFPAFVFTDWLIEITATLDSRQLFLYYLFSMLVVVYIFVLDNRLWMEFVMFCILFYVRHFSFTRIFLFKYFFTLIFNCMPSYILMDHCCVTFHYYDVPCHEDGPSLASEVFVLNSPKSRQEAEGYCPVSVSFSIIYMGYHHYSPDMSIGAQTLPWTYTSVSIG
jgi:hypothetical protein